MARSKPTRSIELTYAKVSQTNDGGVLYPCYIGPRYILHKLANENTLVGKFVAGKGVESGDKHMLNLPYPSQSVENVVLDTDTVSVKVTDALLQVATGLTITSVKGNCITFAKAVAGENAFTELAGYDVRKGDVITINDTDMLVTGVKAATTAEKISVLNGTDGAEVTGVSASGTFKGKEDSVYIITIIENKDNNVVANLAATNGDLNTTNTSRVTFIKGTATSIGSQGVEVTFAETFDAAEGLFIVHATAAKAGDLVEVYVNATDIADATEATIYTRNIYAGALDVAAAAYTAAAGEVILTNELKVSLGNKEYAVKEANLHICYRELITADANMLMAGDAAGLDKFIGEVDPSNPLAFMVDCARVVGTNAFYAIATAGTSFEDYAKALDIAFKFENVFAPITFDQSDKVREYSKEQMAFYNSPAVAQFKKLWFADNTELTDVVYDHTSEGYGLLIKMDASGNVTLLKGDFISAGVLEDDRIVIPNHFDAKTQNYVNKEYVIDTVVDAGTVIVKNADMVIETPEICKVVRSFSDIEYAETVGNKAASNDSAYINYVWANKPSRIGYGVCDSVYLVCTLAALRAVNAPHAPLSEVIVPGWEVAEDGFSEMVLDIMNDKGVWIVYKDRYGSVITRHQLTTVQDGTLAEEDSAVSNACNIVRSLRSMLYNYRGDANVTDELIGALNSDIRHSLDLIRSRVYPFKIGRQITDYNIKDLRIDEDNRARIILDADIDVPEPLLDGNFKFNII